MTCIDLQDPDTSVVTSITERKGKEDTTDTYLNFNGAPSSAFQCKARVIRSAKSNEERASDNAKNASKVSNSRGMFLALEDSDNPVRHAHGIEMAKAINKQVAEHLIAKGYPEKDIKPVFRIKEDDENNVTFGIKIQREKDKAGNFLYETRVGVSKVCGRKSNGSLVLTNRVKYSDPKSRQLNLDDVPNGSCCQFQLSFNKLQTAMVDVPGKRGKETRYVFSIYANAIAIIGEPATPEIVIGGMKTASAADCDAADVTFFDDETGAGAHQLSAPDDNASTAGVYDNGEGMDAYGFDSVGDTGGTFGGGGGGGGGGGSGTGGTGGTGASGEVGDGAPQATAPAMQVTLPDDMDDDVPPAKRTRVRL